MQNYKLVSFAFAAAIATSLSAVACSDDDKAGSSPDDVSSVDEDKAIDSLSESEAREYCEDGQKFIADNYSDVDTKKFSCGISGFVAALQAQAETDAEAQAACRTAFDQCMARPDETPGGDAGPNNEDSCSDFINDAKTCKATVGEYNKCLADQTTLFKDLAKKDFCAEVKADATGDELNLGVELPASCKAIQSKCPGLAGDEEEE